MRPSQTLLGVLSSVALLSPSAAQTYSNCNPLNNGNCPPDSALGKSVDIDFTSGQSDSFTEQGDVTYDSNGASFTVAASGDNPQLTSKWYIMFGRVDVVLKAAPGAGIVSSFVMQSDTLDEIDWEWLGADNAQVQTNYFGKGQTFDYNRGAFHGDAGNQDGFKTYTIEWTSSQIAWQIDGQTVRTLTPETAESNQYPQTPMQIKMGAWSGGDSSNSPGTIEWSRGPTDYSQGPYTMQVKSVNVQDYSTGTQYVYKGSSGSWQDIEAVGGTVNSGGTQVDSAAPAITSTTNGQPIPFDGTHGETTTWVTPSEYPWVPYETTVSAAAAPTYANYPGLPSGWTVSDSGKVVPPSSAPSTSQAAHITSSPQASAQAAPSQFGQYEQITTYDEQGFKTVVAVPEGWDTAAKSYDDKGFLITPSPASRPTDLKMQAAQAQAESQTMVPAAQSSDADSAAAPQSADARVKMSLAWAAAMLGTGALLVL